MPSTLSKLVAAAALIGASDALLLQPSCCAVSRLPASRIASSAICMCDGAVEEAPAAEAAPAPAAKAAKMPLDQLVVGTEVEGTIRSVMAYGAFVDIGAATDGLLHVSEISHEYVKDATEKLTAGDTFKGRISGINLEKQQLALSSKDPNAAPPPRERKPRQKVDLSEFEGADDKEFRTGTVHSITDFGAFVTLKPGVDGLVHISQIQEGGVGKVEDVLKEGQEVKVRIVQVDKAKRRIGLSMLEWSENEGKKGRRGGGGGGFGGDLGFGEADKEFQMNAEELATLDIGDEFSSPFDAAMERAEFVKSAKAKKERYARQVL